MSFEPTYLGRSLLNVISIRSQHLTTFTEVTNDEKYDSKSLCAHPGTNDPSCCVAISQARAFSRYDASVQTLW